MRINAIRSRCALFIFAWILNTKAEKSSLHRIDHARSLHFSEAARWSSSGNAPGRSPHRSWSARNRKIPGTALLCCTSSMIKLCACAVQKLDLIHQLRLGMLRTDELHLRRIVHQRTPVAVHLLRALLRIGEGRDLLCLTVINTLEILYRSRSAS